MTTVWRPDHAKDKSQSGNMYNIISEVHMASWKRSFTINRCGLGWLITFRITVVLWIQLNNNSKLGQVAIDSSLGTVSADSKTENQQNSHFFGSVLN